MSTIPVGGLGVIVMSTGAGVCTTGGVTTAGGGTTITAAGVGAFTNKQVCVLT